MPLPPTPAPNPLRRLKVKPDDDAWLDRVGKAVAAITWKAGLKMETAMMIQRKVARVQPKNMAYETDDGGFPLSEDEMVWYLDSYE